ncbi:MAG TPA: GTPase [Streptosporangiaceae bacterium]|nr:GTPase [Streptosporangiaceae bacterium]
MTEGTDAAAAQLPPGGVGRPRPAAAADPSFPGAATVPGLSGPAASFAEVAMPAPVPAGSPDIVRAAEQSGTGRPSGDGDPGGTGPSSGTGDRGGAGAQAGPGARTGTGWPGDVPAGPRDGSDHLAGSPELQQPVSATGDSIWARTVDAEPGGSNPAGTDADDEPFARVDAKKLEAALLGLRHPILTVPLLFESPGVAEARAERVKLLSQIDDYLLPRLRQSGAPILVALVGSTGAGKSTLMNSVVAKQVSATGIRRPTTNSPVLACHPDDMRWFAENVFLPTLPRVRQQGLAMPGRDGLLVLAASEGMPKGVAVLDTPDIDSVVQAHRDFADQFLDASDLWLFVTTARRYADAAVWEMLQDARDRGAALAIALSRVPPQAAGELATHFDAMLEANGLREVRRFIIPETVITDAQLPPDVSAPIREWLADTARQDDRRVAVLTQTMSGVLDTFRSRVPALADQVTAQLGLRSQLRETVDAAYAAGLTELEEATGNGSLLHGEVLARWQDFAGTGDLLRTLQVRRGRGGGRQRKQQLPARAIALRSALQASMISLITATADRAAEVAVAGWQQQHAGGALLADSGSAASRPGTSSAVSSEADYVASALADLGLVSDASTDAGDRDPAALASATAGLAATAAAAVRAWQANIRKLVKDEHVTRRSIARVVSFDEDSLALVLTIGILGSAAPAHAAGDEASGDAVLQQLLESLFGAGLLREIGARIRLDLRERVGQLFEVEAERFFAIIDSAGVPEDGAASELLQAGDALEGAR